MKTGAGSEWVVDGGKAGGDMLLHSKPQRLLPCASFLAACRVHSLSSSPEEMQTSLSTLDAPTAIFVTVKLSQTCI